MSSYLHCVAPPPRIVGGEERLELTQYLGVEGVCLDGLFVHQFNVSRIVYGSQHRSRDVLAGAALGHFPRRASRTSRPENLHLFFSIGKAIREEMEAQQLNGKAYLFTAI